jgi:hypothetical protein
MPLLPRRRRNQPTMPSVTDTASEPARCTTTTVKGHRCQLPAHGGPFCRLHAVPPGRREGTAG